MMFGFHVRDRLAGYHDGALDAREMARVREHLIRCKQCRGELEQIAFASGLARQLPMVEAPAAVWNAIEAVLDKPVRPQVLVPRRLAYGLLAGLVAIAAGAGWYWTWPAPVQWAVAQVEGAPTVGSRKLSGAGRIAEGQWVETDSASRASITVGTIGTVEVAPNSRVRLTVAKPNEHRLTLERGEISAVVNAPPRLFFVDTSSSTAVDLGCAYKMNVDDDGNGLLQVTLGWVALEWAGKSSEVPAGAYCRTRRKVGPGTPYFEDASERFQRLLARFDAGEKQDTLDEILQEARLRDTLSVWHLLSRVPPGDRERVYDRLVELASLPQGITKEKSLALDRETLKRWGDELVLKW